MYTNQGPKDCCCSSALQPPPPERAIKLAVQRLEKAAEILDATVAAIASAFSPVIHHRPMAGALGQEAPTAGSDLGQALMQLAARFEQSNASLQMIAEQSDL